MALGIIISLIINNASHGKAMASARNRNDVAALNDHNESGLPWLEGVKRHKPAGNQ